MDLELTRLHGSRPYQARPFSILPNKYRKFHTHLFRTAILLLGASLLA
jgi:hypothetical protein